MLVISGAGSFPARGLTRLWSGETGRHLAHPPGARLKVRRYPRMFHVKHDPARPFPRPWSCST